MSISRSPSSNALSITPIAKRTAIVYLGIVISFGRINWFASDAVRRMRTAWAI